MGRRREGVKEGGREWRRECEREGVASVHGREGVEDGDEVPDVGRSEGGKIADSRCSKGRRRLAG